MTRSKILLATVGAAVALCAPAMGFERMEGCLIADRACEATRSIRRESNPGSVQLEVGQTYELLGANKLAATHFQVRVPSASPDARWVEVSCGRMVEECELSPGDGNGHRVDGASSANNLLAVSWQPVFCETHRTKTECASQTEDRFDATNLALHGLWPQPRDKAYCGVNATIKAIDRRGRWDLLPPVELTKGTENALDDVMPGTQSMLERHEWIKHGTCYSATAEEYYRESLQLMRELNASPVRELFAENIGSSIRLDEIRAAFDAAFGAGAGERVTIDCKRTGGRNLITELRINLVGEITEAITLKDLLMAAPEAGESCTEGMVDPAGFESE